MLQLLLLLVPVLLGASWPASQASRLALDVFVVAMLRDHWAKQLSALAPARVNQRCSPRRRLWPVLRSRPENLRR